MRFVNIQNHNINMTHVRHYHFTADGWLNLTYSDGEQGCFRVGAGDTLREELAGARHIVQLVPVPGNVPPLWMVWALDDGTHTAERVLFFALTDSGIVCPIGTGWGYFDIEDGDYTLCTEDELCRFQNLTRRVLIQPMEVPQTVDPWAVGGGESNGEKQQ